MEVKSVVDMIGYIQREETRKEKVWLIFSVLRVAGELIDGVWEDFGKCDMTCDWKTIDLGLQYL